MDVLIPVSTIALGPLLVYLLGRPLLRDINSPLLDEQVARFRAISPMVPMLLAGFSVILLGYRHFGDRLWHQAWVSA